MILRALPSHVKLVEVGPRDGLQNEAEIVPTDVKVAFIDALSAAGPAEIEVTSFVSRRRIPQLADAAQVTARIERRPGIAYSALVPNMKGLERALAAGVERIAVFTAASETFNQRNINASIDESIERFRPVVEGARAARVSVRGYVSTAFLCPYEGAIAPEQAAGVIERLFALGVDEVSIGDTIGAAVPSQVDALLDHVQRFLPVERTAMHFHDTRGTALANVLVCLQRGVAIFDCSAGGLGGCPYAPGASGNLATEDLCYFLHGLGIHTGVDLDRLSAASSILEDVLDHPLPSRVRRAAGGRR